jgi:TrmH family RNA methyltransferase
VSHLGTAGVIDEPSHPRVRAARRCHRASGRAKVGRFLAEGPPAARAALARPGVVIEVFATADWLSEASLSMSDVPVHVVTERVLAAVAETTSPQGLVAVCRDVTVGLEALLAAAPRLVVVLAEVRDPGNVGTIIRTADAAGADGVVLTAESVDPLGGKCVRSTVGSIFHLPIIVDQGVEALDRLRDAGLRVLATDGTAALDLNQAAAQGRLDGPTAWIVGNEANGVPPRYFAAADDVVRIPMYGQAESLNASVAAALCLYASATAHRAPS